MEGLRKCLPERIVEESLRRFAAGNLQGACQSLGKFFEREGARILEEAVFPLARQENSPCAKDASEAELQKQDGNKAFSGRRYEKSIELYTRALKLASPADNPDFTAQCYANRAATLQALGHLEAAERDVSRALQLKSNYSKALFRRGCIRTKLGRLSEATDDLESAMQAEVAANGPKGSIDQIGRELAQVRRLASSRPGPRHASDPVDATIAGGIDTIQSDPSRAIPSSQGNRGACSSESGFHGASVQRCLGDGGLGAVSDGSLRGGEIVLKERALAAVLLKPFRESRCHYCFDSLPLDPRPCSGCSFSIYCSDACQLMAYFGKVPPHAFAGSNEGPNDTALKSDLPEMTVRQGETKLPLTGSDETPNAASLESHVANMTVGQDSVPSPGAGAGVGSGEARFGEHLPECGGAAWAAVLPIEVTLASRVCHRAGWNVQGKNEDDGKVSDLCHHMDRIPGEDFLSLAILAIVAAKCLNPVRQGQSLQSPSVTGTLADASWKLLETIAVLRANAVGVSLLVENGGSSPEASRSPQSSAEGSQKDPQPAQIRPVQHVTVAQALFCKASRFNHSCQPNTFLSFNRRTVTARAVKTIAARQQLCISYGAQRGEMTAGERQQWLLSRYNFSCACQACAEGSSEADVAFHGLSCKTTNCQGIVQFQQWYTPGDSGSIAKTITSTDPQTVKCTKCAVAPFKSTTELQKALQSVQVALDSLDGIDEMGSDKDALRMAKAHLKLLESVLHPMNRLMAKAYDSLARATLAAGMSKEALVFCRKSVAVLEHHYWPMSLQLVEEYSKLASVAALAGDTTTCKQFSRAAQKICDVHYGQIPSGLL